MTGIALIIWQIIIDGKEKSKVDFLVCDKIRRPCYIGLDFLRKHKVGIEWSSTGKLELQVRNNINLWLSP